ncbi:MAG: hypothetical protein PHD67_09810 [Oscillospiraceae bacterium]|nr:hypothetical protein [Oscillospiraceae bacterium]
MLAIAIKTAAKDILPHGALNIGARLRQIAETRTEDQKHTVKIHPVISAAKSISIRFLWLLRAAGAFSVFIRKVCKKRFHPVGSIRGFDKGGAAAVSLYGLAQFTVDAVGNNRPAAKTALICPYGFIFYRNAQFVHAILPFVICQESLLFHPLEKDGFNRNMKPSGGLLAKGGRP